MGIKLVFHTTWGFYWMYELPKHPASWGQLDGSLHGTIKMCTKYTY